MEHHRMRSSVLPFSIALSCILNIQLPVGCKIISYADDLAIISTSRYCLRRAQRCLDLVSEECCTTGLKISATKSKVMALRLNKKIIATKLSRGWV